MKTDAVLVKAAAAGDRDAAADLVERHTPAVYAVCLGLLADPDRAQDIAQDTLLKAVQKLGSLRDPSTFKAWLVSIARNLCRDSWKQARRRRELLEERTAGARHEATVGSDMYLWPMPGLGSTSEPDPSAPEPDVQAALARLPENHRLPLLLYYFDGYSSARVGEALGISPTGARARLCRARRALREILEVDHA